MKNVAVWSKTLVSGCVFIAAGSAKASIAENQVLVVYNSASAEGTALKNSYLAAHPGISAANVVDLNNPLLITFDLTSAQFINSVRDPIRNHLLVAGPPAPSDIIAIVLIRPIPHRLRDSDNPSAGDGPSTASAETQAGDATFASVDAELALLWQDLYSTEAGATMDSRSDNVIDNPYHQNTAGIHTFSRAAIQTAKSFTNNSDFYWALGGSGATRLTPGDMYLVCRLDGNNAADATALIGRAQDLAVNKAAVRVILDEYNLSAREDLDDDAVFTPPDPFLAGDDYEETRTLLENDIWRVRYDDTADFISAGEENIPVIAYASYGENHALAGENPAGTGTYIDGFDFARGAMFNTYESYNGRAFNGLGPTLGQEQVADFIAAGGTFGVGHVYEPFTFTIPDNEFLFVNMLVRQMTWAEAAYASIPVLSWQHVVVGDPLGRFDAVVELLGDCDADAAVDQADYAQYAGCISGPLTPASAACDCADLDGDGDSDLYDYAGFQLFFGQSAR